MNNLLFTAHLAVAESAYALGKALDIDQAKLAEVLKNGSGASFGATIVPGAGFTLAPMGAMAGPLLQKDVRLVAELAEAAGAPTGVVFDAADAALSAMGTPR
jgi:3-hydroxyisobutyrate dehydrogenase-like beta-hydroxyacid dehydrogenase